MKRSQQQPVAIWKTNTPNGFGNGASLKLSQTIIIIIHVRCAMWINNNNIGTDWGETTGDFSGLTSM